MLLAVGQLFREQGFDPTTRLWFEAADISPLCFQMTYIQATLSGLAGRVSCRNSLTTEAASETALTFGAVKFIARNGPPWARAQPAAVLPVVPSRSPAAAQGSLFP